MIKKLLISSFPFLVFILLVGLAVFPTFAHAQILEIPCDGFVNECDFTDFVQLAQNVVTFLILLSIPLATMAFAWAGWLLLTAGGNSGQVDHAKEIFWKVLKGFLFALTAWLIVRLITEALLNEDMYEDLLTLL